MRPEFSIRELRQSDREEINVLFAKSFGKSRNRSLEDWKYFMTPYGVVPGMVAVVSGQIVASYTAWPVDVLLEGHTVLGAQSMDTMTDPDYRRQGLFVGLARACYESMSGAGYKILYGFPNDSVYEPRVRLLDWVHVADVPYYKAINALPLRSYLALRNSCDKLVDRRTVRTIQISDVLFDDLDLDRLRGVEGCAIGRSRKWLEWRYSSASGLNYRWLVVRTNNTPSAAIAYRVDQGSCYLAEVTGAPSSIGLGLAELSAALIGSGVTRLVSLTSDRQLAKTLRNYFFLRRGHQRFIVRPLAPDVPRQLVLRGENWRISGGDFDVF